MTLARKNILLLACVALLAVIPLLMINDSEFTGADGLAEEAIMVINPDYEPWIGAIWEPPGGETEGLLFALQAALGSGFLGYYIGMRRGQAKERVK
jgi:cobalt/nickel transport protein